MLGSRRRSANTVNAWPGYVDALSALLLLVIFMLLMFTIAQVFLAKTVSERDDELSRLTQRLNEISASLRLEQATNQELSSALSSLHRNYQNTLEREQALAGEVEELQATLRADRDTIEAQARELLSLEQDLIALRALRNELESEVAQLSGQLAERDENIAELEDDQAQQRQQIGALRDRNRALEARLADEEERTLLAQQELEQRDRQVTRLTQQIADTEASLDSEQERSSELRDSKDRLSEQIDDLQQQLEVISEALVQEEARTAEQELEIADLGERLNTALARKVTELERYRSEFFGRLRNVLEQNPEVRVEGERFLLPSELFFDSASANVNEPGKAELDKLAQVMRELNQELPSDLDWILRIDGHTDRIPINTPRFPSNWELSTARAVAVLRYLAEQGVPEARMAAAGFGEFHPLDPRNTPAAYQRNRRIEVRLTNR